MGIHPLHLPIECWPEVDRQRWLRAQIPPGFLEPAKPASTWSSARRLIVQQKYGQWLSFLLRHGWLNGASMPGERVTDQRLQQFVEELSARLAPASVSMVIGALQRMLAVIEPDHDWSDLGRLYGHLKRTARPTREKLARIVPATDLLTLGFRLMNTCSEARNKIGVATQFRDGLLISVLICCPVRLGNLTMIDLGRHLSFDGRLYRLQFCRSETKTGHPYVASLPRCLTAYLDEYLTTHRPALQSISSADRNPDSASGPLWWNRFGRPMTMGGIRKQIEWRTEQAFGKPVWPHLFRDCAVTELVDVAPQDIGIAPDVLGHRTLRTTRKHYIQARGMIAHLRVQELIGKRRRSTAQTAVNSGDDIDDRAIEWNN